MAHDKGARFSSTRNERIRASSLLSRKEISGELASLTQEFLTSKESSRSNESSNDYEGKPISKVINRFSASALLLMIYHLIADLASLPRFGCRYASQFMSAACSLICLVSRNIVVAFRQLAIGVLQEHEYARRKLFGTVEREKPAHRMGKSYRLRKSLDPLTGKVRTHEKSSLHS